jgi:hypothetical protein
MAHRTELLEIAVALAEAAEAGKVAEDMLIAAAGGLDAREGSSWQMLRWRLEKVAKELVTANPQLAADQRRRSADVLADFTRLASSAHARPVPSDVDLPHPLFTLPDDIAEWRDRLMADERKKTAALLHNDVSRLRGDIQRVGITLKLLIMRLDDAHTG